jgi:hypothetical protein
MQDAVPGLVADDPGSVDVVFDETPACAVAPVRPNIATSEGTIMGMPFEIIER